MRFVVHLVSLHLDVAGADENVLKEASENWKLEVIKNLESRTSMQRDSICSWELVNVVTSHFLKHGLTLFNIFYHNGFRMKIVQLRS